MDTSILIDIAVWGGIMLLITVIMDWLKMIGIIKEPEQGKKWASIVQLTLSIAVTAVGWFWPDWLNTALPLIDQIAGTFAEIGAGVLVLYPLFIKLGQLFHDIFSDVPFFGRVLTAKIT